MAWRNVWRNRRRTLVTVAAMSFALFVMILYAGLMDGYIRGMERSIVELEVGDVIPLDGKVGDLARFCVEGKPFARGVLGARQGLLAVRIEQLESETEKSR